MDKAKSERKVATVRDKITGQVFVAVGDDAVKLAVAAARGMRIDGHEVVDAERLEDCVSLRTKCGQVVKISVPMSDGDKKRSRRPVKCSKCRAAKRGAS